MSKLPGNECSDESEEGAGDDVLSTHLSLKPKKTGSAHVTLVPAKLKNSLTYHSGCNVFKNALEVIKI